MKNFKISLKEKCKIAERNLNLARFKDEYEKNGHKDEKQNIIPKIERLENPVLLFSIPKTGTTSLENTLYKKNPNFMEVASAAGVLVDGEFTYPLFDNIKLSVHIRNQLTQEEWDKCFKFSFVRNPYERAISSWRYFTGVDCGQFSIRGLFKEFTFLDFAKDLRDDNLNYYERWHSRVQLDFISDDNDNILMDFVGRLENIQEDFDKLCKKINIKTSKIPWLNRSEHEHYTTYYDDEVYGIISNYYKRDIEAFNYKFGE